MNHFSENNSAARLTKQQLCGIFLPVTTPFHPDGAINFDGLRANILQWNATGVGGYVLLGSTGERVNLSEAEQFEVFAAAREVVQQDRLFIAGVGQQSTYSTIAEIRKLSSGIELDAVLVITPHYYRPAIMQAALIEHYHAIGDASPVPVILYSMPALTGVKIEPETAATLSRHQNIVGIKDSSNDIESLRKTIDFSGEEFAVLTGNGTVLREALHAGACGGILAVGCVAPDLCLEIFRAMRAGDFERAKSLQTALTPLATAVTTRFGLGGLKACLEMIGYVGGEVRAPLIAASGEAHAEIRKCLETAAAALDKAMVST